MLVLIFTEEMGLLVDTYVRTLQSMLYINLILIIDKQSPEIQLRMISMSDHDYMLSMVHMLF
jgi:hypothetical protein